MDSFSFPVTQDKALKELLQKNQARLSSKSRFVLKQDISDRTKYAPPPKKKQPDATTHLLQTLERFPCLWDTANEQYCNKTIRRMAYQQMARQLNIVGDNFESKVRAKIKSVRQIYVDELVKINRSKRFTHNVYKPSLGWFDLAHKILAPSTERNLSCVSIASMADDSASENSSVTNSLLQELEKKSQMFATDDAEEKRPIKRKRFSMNSDIDDNLSTFSKSTNYDDEFEIFGRNVACHLRKLSEELALESQSFIQSYLINQRLKNKKCINLPSQSQNGMENCSLSALKPITNSATSTAAEPMDLSVEGLENIPVTKKDDEKKEIDNNNVPEVKTVDSDDNKKENRGNGKSEVVDVEKIKSELVKEIIGNISKEIQIDMVELNQDVEIDEEPKLNASNSDLKEIQDSERNNKENNLINEENAATSDEIKNVENQEKLEIQEAPDIVLAESANDENKQQMTAKSYSEPTIEDNLNEFITIRRKPNQIIEEIYKDCEIDAENEINDSEEEEEDDDDDEEEEEEESDEEILDTVYGNNDSDGDAADAVEDEDDDVVAVESESDASPHENDSPEKNYVEMKAREFSSADEPFEMPFCNLNNGTSRFDSTQRQNYDNLSKMYIDSVPVQLAKSISVEATNSELPDLN